MRKLIKTIVVLLFLVLLNMVNVYATGGGLRRASIKTCPDGVTYGLHSDGHGGTHWHRAATNGDNYYAVGDAIYNDPCPGSSGNQGTAESTHGGGSNNSSSSNNNYNAYSQPIAPVTPVTPAAPAAPSTPPEVQKSEDATLKSLTVDDKKIEISDTMAFETDKDSINIDATANHAKANVKVKGETNELKLDNKFEIVVTAEAGNTKTYTLNVTRKPGISKTKLTLKVNNYSIEFDENNHYDTTELFYTDKIKFTYTLSNQKSSLKIYKDNKEISTEDNISLGDNNYRFLIVDENGDSIEYTLKVTKEGVIESIIILILIIGILGGFGFFIFWIIKKIKKR